MTHRYWYDQQSEQFDSISEIIAYERHRLINHDSIVHPLGRWGPVDLEIDQHIDQSAPIMLQIKGRRFHTRALASFENIYHAAPNIADRIILGSEHPYIGITDGDRCLEHAIFNERTQRYEIAAIYDPNCGGCGAMVWLTRQFEKFMWQCCPENEWPEGSQLAKRQIMMRIYAVAKENCRPGIGRHPDQLPLFDGLTLPNPSQYRRPLDIGNKILPISPPPDDDEMQQFNYRDGA